MHPCFPNLPVNLFIPLYSFPRAGLSDWCFKTLGKHCFTVPEAGNPGASRPLLPGRPQERTRPLPFSWLQSLAAVPGLPGLMDPHSNLLSLHGALPVCPAPHSCLFYEHQSCWSRATLCRGDLILLITSAATLYLSQVTF